MVTTVAVGTCLVVMVNVPYLEPAGTVTELGMTALLSLRDRSTFVPFDGAGALISTIPLAVPYTPTTSLGLMPKPSMVGGSTAIVAEAVVRSTAVPVMVTIF